MILSLIKTMKRLSLKTTKFKKKKPESPQTKLLRLIFERHGGIAAIAKKLKRSKQLIFIWRAKGYVPLSNVAEVAEILKVSPFALNFKEYSNLCIFRENPKWESIYNDCVSQLPAAF